jgi:HK97 family phage major capsid protein
MTTIGTLRNRAEAATGRHGDDAPMSTKHPLLAERAQTMRLFSEVRDRPDSVTYHVHKNRIGEIDAELRAAFGDGFDIAFRQLVNDGRGSFEAPLNLRALGATARGNLSAFGFVETFAGAMAAAAPLLDLATIVPTTNGADVDFSFATTLPTANGIVADGATITASDPVFAGAALKAYAYKDLIRMSNEVLTDGAWSAEQWAGDRMGANVAFKLSADLWGGGGSTAPEGLLAGLSTVTAAGAAIVTFDDVAALLNGVPAAYRYSGRCTILLSPGAHVDLMEEQPLHDWASGTIHGFPFRVDAQLADPATTTKSVVAGDFETAYVVRLMPLRVEMNPKPHFNSDESSLRTVLRADGRRMVMNAARALVHP